MAFYDDKKLLNNLIEVEVISEDILQQAFKKSQEKEISFAKVLVNDDLVSPKTLVRFISDLAELPYIFLTDTPIDKKILNIIPEVVSRKQLVMAFKQDEAGLHVGMVDPSNEQIKEFLTKKTGLVIKPYISLESDMLDAFSIYSKDVGVVFEDIIKSSLEEVKNNSKAEPPIIKIVDTIITYADQNKASDIHLEPMDEKSLVRFRIDGVLHDVIELPRNLHEPIVTRIKVLSRLRTDEHQSAQDGKLQYKIKNGKLDVRVSIVPITEGEQIVMRLLSERSRQFSLADLGFSTKDLQKVEAERKKPHGMILATGPTGAGKTTTLYAILKLLNKRNVNIMTIEDPVEYDMGGVNQIQVNKKTDLTFSAGLRSIVRQDPDIILVGEIRDEETADIAINSAMTGHLVLSSLHTNDAATSIPRLLDMQVEPFLVASTVNLIIAQRLLRKLCQNCRISKEVPMSDISKNISSELATQVFGEVESVRTYSGKGCIVCHDTGYVGRVGIFEVLTIDDEIREAIVSRKDATIIHDLAVKAGMITMIEDGLEKVKQGLTTIEEVVRVTKE